MKNVFFIALGNSIYHSSELIEAKDTIFKTKKAKLQEYTLSDLFIHRY